MLFSELGNALDPTMAPPTSVVALIMFSVRGTHHVRSGNYSTERSLILLFITVLLLHNL